MPKHCSCVGAYDLCPAHEVHAPAVAPMWALQALLTPQVAGCDFLEGSIDLSAAVYGAGPNFSV